MHLEDETASFELRHLAEVLQRLGGSAGVSCFAVGLYGAGISSALTVPLGSALAAAEETAALSLHTPAGCEQVPLGSALAVEDLLGWRATPQPGEKRGESSKGSRSSKQPPRSKIGTPSLTPKRPRRRGLDPRPLGTGAREETIVTIVASPPETGLPPASP